ncbi:MAG: transcription elongation factor GreA [Candidatus Omnitrophica bacterium]|nr:transcription elongation factor GreA [Candidatus Omnitrophota bacterium]
MVVRLTKQGLEKLQQELNYLKTVKRREAIEAIARAREKGDLRENAEYDAAKEAQGHLEKRIAELSDQLSRVDIIDESRMDQSKAFIGATVALKDMDNGKQLTYVLVSKEEADFKAGRISIDSPVGKALLGKGAGETVEVKIPAGTLKYKVENVSR